MKAAARLRRLSFCFILIVTSLVLGACSLPSVKEASPEPSDKDPLVVGLNFQNAPFSIDENGKLSGYNIDIAAALAQEMGTSVSFVDVGNTDGIDELRRNQKIDIIMSPGSAVSTPEGIDVVVRNYNANAPGLFTLTSNGEPAQATVQDIEKASIAVQGDSVSDKLVAKLFPTAKRLQLRSVNECFEALATEKVKYVACDSLQGSYLANNYSNAAPAGLLEVAESMNILARSKSQQPTQKLEDLRRAADSLRAGGVFDLISRKWFGKFMGATTTGNVIELDEARKKAIFDVEQSLASAAVAPMPEGELTPGANVSLPTERSHN